MDGTLTQRAIASGNPAPLADLKETRMAEIVKLGTKAAKERARRLRHLKQAAEVLRVEAESARIRQASAYVSLALDKLSEDELSARDFDVILRSASLIMRAVRLDIYARLTAPRLAAIEAQDKITPLRGA
jgi:hypothetical protein